MRHYNSNKNNNIFDKIETDLDELKKGNNNITFGPKNYVLHDHSIDKSAITIENNQISLKEINNKIEAIKRILIVKGIIDDEEEFEDVIRAIELTEKLADNK
jgi:hypothetical protein